MKTVQIAMKKKDGKWNGALLVDREFQGAEVNMNVVQYNGAVIGSLIETVADDVPVTVTIEIGRVNG